MTLTFEPIGGGLSVAVDERMRVQEDALLLARFAAPTADDRACDLGTGNGIIPLLWCRRTPPQTMTAVEREPHFCRMARAAIERHGLCDRITLTEANWNDTAAMPPAGSMTLVTCNPPFFAFGEGRPSPDPLRDAMRHEDSPAMLSELSRAAARLLANGGRFCLCHRPARLPDVLQALNSAGLTPTRLQLVQSQDGARAHLVLLEAKRTGPLDVLPTLVTADKGQGTEVYHRLFR